MAGWKDLRAVARSVAGRAGEAAYSRAPSPVREAIERVQARYESKKLDAQRAMEELSGLEEQAREVAIKILLFPWATAGAIKELYSRTKELERSLESRDQVIAKLEARIRDLERGR